MLHRRSKRESKIKNTPAGFAVVHRQNFITLSQMTTARRKYCNESVIPFQCHVTLMVGKRFLQRSLMDAKPMTPNLGDKPGDYLDLATILSTLVTK
ncbi:hypothetical protein AVEN_25198-1 [Araneus ventricosus]|uniref:Uncharacterized protein n=1 Tax=Araneus ventricosus TaxID=182803 RepID=A0A4Y2SV96_ARAVE|nr:hypothetical protein AVEN_25198-1 [Araneus ventricosus]